MYDKLGDQGETVEEDGLMRQLGRVIGRAATTWMYDKEYAMLLETTDPHRGKLYRLHHQAMQQVIGILGEMGVPLSGIPEAKGEN